MARTRGNESLGPTKQQRGQRRRVVHVFTEGRVTEPTYIEVVSDLVRLHDQGVEVRVANANAPGSQRKPIKLVEAAVRLMREEARAAKRSGVKEELWPQVWCLFDRDAHESVDAALKQAREGDVQVAFSHPCFEVWRLLHHKPVTGTFGGVCGEAEARLPFVKEPGNIKVVLPTQIEGGFIKAKARAEKMNGEHGKHVPLTQRDPYTDVHDFVEKGLGIASY
ncbi:RloB family protein [Kitasatospora sp. NPDC058032]|uniref:RloB family protein n=1 Tax=Kitasatospora sp. NPDC058032 TaxID=3346307 RepID=UPI0036DF8C08